MERIVAIELENGGLSLSLPDTFLSVDVKEGKETYKLPGLPDYIFADKKNQVILSLNYEQQKAAEKDLVRNLEFIEQVMKKKGVLLSEKGRVENQKNNIIFMRFEYKGESHLMYQATTGENVAICVLRSPIEQRNPEREQNIMQSLRLWL